MASERKIAANRANSSRSTGPKSPKGKSRAAQNARRHGLSLPVSLNPRLLKEAEELAQRIAGGNLDPGGLKAARLFAEAQIDLERISRFRYEFMARHAECLAPTPVAKDHPNSEQDSYVEHGRTSEPSESERLSVLEQLIKIDRYELRARSRRKFATSMLKIAHKNNSVSNREKEINQDYNRDKVPT